VLWVLWLALQAGPAAAACGSSAPPTLELSVFAGALRGSEDQAQRVRVHEDGCVSVQRPWFLRDAGHYEIRLPAAEWQLLQRRLDTAGLQGLSTASLQQEARRKRQAAASDLEFYESDADLMVLRWRVEGEPRELAWVQTPELAEPASKSRGQQVLADLVQTLQPLLQPRGTRVGSGGAP